MDAHPIAMPTSREIAPTAVVMSSAEYAELVRELDSLRASHRSELAQRLHDVRAHGTASDDDDRLAALDEAAIDRARIARLEDLVRWATVLDDDTVFDGAAGLGSTVEVANEAGRTTTYRLVGRLREPRRRSRLASESVVPVLVASDEAGTRSVAGDRTDGAVVSGLVVPRTTQLIGLGDDVAAGLPAAA